MLIYAHRGASADFTEMTMAAFQGAVAQKADGIECDVRLTADGQIICWHDDSTSRIFGLNLPIARSTLAELRQHGEVVTFQELLDFAIEFHIDLLVETKHPVPTKNRIENELLSLLNLNRTQISASGIRITIQSFSWWAIIWSLRKYHHRALLVDKKFLIKLAFVPAVALGSYLLADGSNIVKRLQSKGKRVFAWTVNDRSETLKMKEFGIDLLITDCPKIAREIITVIRP